MIMPGRMFTALTVPGGSVSGTTQVNGFTVPVDLALTSRTGNEPTQYVASRSIDLEEGFESGVNDDVTAYLTDTSYAGGGNGGSGADGVAGNSKYRYGFNGKEKDNEVKGIGDQIDYGSRIYDPRVGKFLSVDPLQKRFPYYTPYQFSGNTPIQAIDLDGLEPKGYAPGMVDLYKNLSVKPIPSEFDTHGSEGKIGDYSGIINGMAVQDIDKKTYLIYESVHGDRQWYVEYDKDGWKGNVNEFKWNKPVPVGREIYLVTVAPIIALAALPIAAAGAPVMSSSLWGVWSNPYVQATITGDIAAAYAYEYGYGEAGSAASGASGISTNKNSYSAAEQVNTATGLTNSGSIDEKAARMTAVYNQSQSVYDDCSEIAADINKTVSGGNIIEITPKSGRWLNGIEYGKPEEFTNHQFFVKDNMVYDPMFKDKPVTYKEFMKAYNDLNPKGLNVKTIE
jgi:RHS repeat-associated protein